MPFPLPPASLSSVLGLPLTHRFGVFFFKAGIIPNPLDIRFQKVSGLSAQVETEPLKSGGTNTVTKLVPKRIGYQNLLLERGYVMASPLSIEVADVINKFRFCRSDILVTLFNEDAIPMCAWMFSEAWPVKWSIGALDAMQERILIDELEFTFTRMNVVSL